MRINFWKSLDRNTRIVLAVCVVFALWMLSGLVLPSKLVPEVMRAPSNEVSVQAVRIAPQAFTRTLKLIGRTEADEKATLSARTGGVIEHLLVQRGSVVKQGDTLLRLDIAKRKIQQTAARAELTSAQKLANSARELAKDGYISASILAEREAKLAGAKQALALIDQDLAYTYIKAPFDGVVEDTQINMGDFVNVGAPLLTLVKPSGVLVVADVGQTERDQLSTPSPMDITLVNGQQVSATLGFVAGDANPGTRTFRIEGRLTNVAHAPVPLGMTANISIPLQNVMAYAIPHAWLVLGDAGQVAAMVVQNQVSGTINITTARKYAVNVLQDTPSHVWVNGLPETEVVLINRGQAALTSGMVVSATLVKE